MRKISFICYRTCNRQSRDRLPFLTTRAEEIVAPIDPALLSQFTCLNFRLTRMVFAF